MSQKHCVFSSLGEVVVLTRPEAAAMSLISEWLDHRARCQQAPGYQLCIRKHGQLILAASYGRSDIAAGTPLKNSDYMALGSQTKSFTACIALQLIEAGALTFDTRLGTALTELSECSDARISNITIKDLLMHRAGFARDYADTIFDETVSSDNPDKDYAHLIHHVKQCALVYQPDTKTKYSNLGFALLGCVLERATGTSYQELVDTYINDKINTGFVISPSGAEGNNQAVGYSGMLGDGKRYPMPCAPLQAAVGAAGLWGTAIDTSLFFHEYIYGTTLLSGHMRQKLHEDAFVVANFPASRYGYALIHGRANGTAYLGHVGESPGFASQTFAIDDGKYLISISMNSGETVVRDIFPNIAGILLHMNKVFDQHQPIRVTRPMADRRGTFVVAANANRAVHVPLDTWTPYRLATDLTAIGDRTYSSSTQDGYWNVDEPMRLIEDVQGQICMVQWGAMVSRDEKTFLARYTKQ